MDKEISISYDTWDLSGDGTNIAIENPKNLIILNTTKLHVHIR